MFDPDIHAAHLGPSASAGEPEVVTRELVLFDQGDVSVGLWECEPGELDGAVEGFDELMHMVSGRVTVTTDGGSEWDIAPGTTWVTPRGVRCRWTVHQTVRKFWVIDARPYPTGGPIALTANSFRISLGEPHAKATSTTGDQWESDSVLWAANGIEAGVWSCTPGVFATHRDGFDEAVHILEGRGSVSDANGMTYAFGPGSSFVLPNDFRGSWTITSTVRKVFCLIHRR
jgi:uncharacterized cupin superfamily protein